MTEDEVPSNLQEERRELRRSYRNQKDKVAANKALNTRLDSSTLYQSLIETDNLFQKVKKPREQVADGEVLALISEQAVELAQGLRPHGGAHCNPQALVSRLKQRHLAGWSADSEESSALEVARSFDWAALGKRLSGHFHTPPSFTCMLGPMSVQVKERKKVERRGKQPVRGELVAPEQVKQGEGAKQQETDRNVKIMVSVLKKVGSALLSSVINNPASFAQTVENLFTLSFLIRDGRAKLVPSPQGVTVVSTSVVAETEPKASVEPSQFVLKFSYHDWEEMQNYVGSTPSLIPNREPHEIDAAGRTVDVDNHEMGTDEQEGMQSHSNSRNRPTEEITNISVSNKRARSCSSKRSTKIE